MLPERSRPDYLARLKWRRKLGRSQATPQGPPLEATLIAALHEIRQSNAMDPATHSSFGRVLHWLKERMPGRGDGPSASS